MAQVPAVHRAPYMRVFVFLIVLTALEVGVAFTPIPKSAQVPFLIALAIAKATLVALYYMHLRFEGPLLRAIAIIPFILSIGLALPPAFDVLAR